MSTSIELLDTGCSGIQVIDKINEIIAALNNVEQTTDYESLSNKPSINGVTLLGNKTTGNLLFALADASDYAALIATLATKAELTAAQLDTVNLASAAVQALLATKIDVSAANVTEATLINEEAYVYIIANDGLRKVSIKNLTSNVALKTVSSKELEKAVRTQLQLLTVTGDQDGTNVSYKVSEVYVSGTSNLFFNGQRMTLGADYSETNGGFVMLTHVPALTDVLVFIAAV